MLLKDANGPNRLTIRVTGYQFPDAPDLAKRFSWHMVGGDAQCQEGSWRFHWQALTCDESPRISAWLTEVAEAIACRRDVPPPLRFLEPNLEFAAVPADLATARVLVSFDLEFQPPWHAQQAAGDPFTLPFTMDEGQLRKAAGQWDAEHAIFPGRAAAPGSGPAWREATATESALLAAAASGDWPGAGELRSQLPGLLARPACSCGCGTIDLQPRQGTPARMAPNPAPREGTVLGPNGEQAGGLLLFLHHGLLQSLEIYSYDDPLPMPPPDRVRWEITEQ
ncbi:MAG: hypothetical protein JWM19_677 [Actinomycetia bacterium]|nr:hypothetical protein [Actinomycetes bacterium]